MASWMYKWGRDITVISLQFSTRYWTLALMSTFVEHFLVATVQLEWVCGSTEESVTVIARIV